MEFCNLASGSKGNCTYISSGQTSILVDEGISFAALKKQCKIVGIDISKIDAVFITHEHIDHVKGVQMLTESLDIPVYFQPQSLYAATKKYGVFSHAVESEFINPIEFEDLAISAFRLSHDAAYTQGFTITDGRKNIVMATDLGYVPDCVYKKLLKGDYIYIESNYDENMLINGPYPYPIKMRINSNKGHLSNKQSSDVITSLAKEGKTRFMLGHLSQNNNTEDMAVQTLYGALLQEKINKNDVEIAVANQANPSRIIEI